MRNFTALLVLIFCCVINGTSAAHLKSSSRVVLDKCFKNFYENDCEFGYEKVISTVNNQWCCIKFIYDDNVVDAEVSIGTVDENMTQDIESDEPESSLEGVDEAQAIDDSSSPRSDDSQLNEDETVESNLHADENIDTDFDEKIGETEINGKFKAVEEVSDDEVEVKGEFFGIGQGELGEGRYGVGAPEELLEDSDFPVSELAIDSERAAEIDIADDSEEIEEKSDDIERETDQNSEGTEREPEDSELQLESDLEEPSMENESSEESRADNETSEEVESDAEIEDESLEESVREAEIEEPVLEPETEEPVPETTISTTTKAPFLSKLKEKSKIKQFNKLLSKKSRKRKSGSFQKIMSKKLPSKSRSGRKMGQNTVEPIRNQEVAESGRERADNIDHSQHFAHNTASVSLDSDKSIRMNEDSKIDHSEQLGDSLEIDSNQAELEDGMNKPQLSGKFESQIEEDRLANDELEFEDEAVLGQAAPELPDGERRKRSLRLSGPILRALIMENA